MGASCVNPLKADLAKTGLSEASYINAVNIWRKQDISGKRDSQIPPYEWFVGYKGSAVHQMKESDPYRNSPQERLARYKQALKKFPAKREWTSDDTPHTKLDEYFKSFNVYFGEGSAYDYTDSDGKRHIGIYNLTANSAPAYTGPVTVEYAPQGKQKQTYTITANDYLGQDGEVHQAYHILDSTGKEVFAGDSPARTQILARFKDAQPKTPVFKGQETSDNDNADNSKTREAIQKTVDEIIRDTSNNGVVTFRDNTTVKSQNNITVIGNDRIRHVASTFEIDRSSGIWAVSDHTQDIIPETLKERMMLRTVDVIPVGQRVTLPESIASMASELGFTKEQGEVFIKTAVRTTDLHISRVESQRYTAAAQANADFGDYVISLAENFDTAEERATSTVAGRKLIKIDIRGKNAEQVGKEIYDRLSAKKRLKLTIAGNWISNLSGSQEEYNGFLTDVLKYLLKNGIGISEIRTGGQTGIDEAGTIAAQNLGLQWSIVTTNDYKMQTRNETLTGKVSAHSYFTDRFNRAFTPVSWKQQKKVEGTPTVRKVYQISELHNAQPYNGTFKLSRLGKNGATSEERRAALLEMLRTEELPIGAKIVIDPSMSADEIIETVKALNSLYKYRVFSSSVNFSLAESKAFSEDELDALDKVSGVKIGENDVFIPIFTIGYSEYELQLIKEDKALRDSGLFKDSELRNLAVASIYKLSEVITRLNSEPEFAKRLFPDTPEFKDLRSKDYTAMSRIEVISTISLSTLLNHVIRESVFNWGNNRIDSFQTMKKMMLIYDNFNAFIRLAYGSLLNLEHLSLTGGFQEMSGEALKVENDPMDDNDEQTIIEIFGSSAEHWQVGFRQVSAVASLSQMIRNRLGQLYDVDEDGNVKRNEVNLPQYINAAGAVAKILAYTEGAETIDDMISRLERYIPKSPWLKQLVSDKYVINGIERVGILKDFKNNDQFRSQFFSNFKKYFQHYTVIYTEGNSRKTRNFNTTAFVDSGYESIMALLKQAENGKSSLWDAKNHKLSDEFYRIFEKVIGRIEKNNRFNEPDPDSFLGILYSERKPEVQRRKYLLPSDWSDETLNMSSLTYRDGILLKKLKEVYASLGIDVPSIGQLAAAFPTFKDLTNITVISTIFNSIYLAGRYSRLDIEALQRESNYFKNMLKPLSGIMDEGHETVTYQSGKLYYSYVMPSYLNLLVDKLKGKSNEEYQHYLEREYGKYVGWFKAPSNADEAKALVHYNPFGRHPGSIEGEWLNPWLRELASDEDLRSQLDHTVVLTDDGVTYAEKSDAAYLASLYQMFNYHSGKEWAWFAVPTMSNKQSEEYVKFRRYTTNIIVDKLASLVFIQEVNRIRTVRARERAFANGTLSEYDRIKNYDGERGKHFMFLTFLNKYLDYSETNNQGLTEPLHIAFAKALQKYVFNEEAFDETGEFRIEIDEWQSYGKFKKRVYTSEQQFFIDQLPKVIKNLMQQEFIKEVQTWDKNGFVKIKAPLKIGVDGKIQGKVYNEYSAALASLDDFEEFFFNHFFASINILQLTVGDLAFYKDAEDVQKRLAQLHSPGARGNVLARDPSNPDTYLTDVKIDPQTGKIVETGYERAITIKDSVGVSEVIENLRQIYADTDGLAKRFNNDKEKIAQYRRFVADVLAAFENVNWADAQAFSSPTSYRKKMGVFGKWDKRQEEAYQRVRKGQYIMEDLNILWQPLKPFVYSQIGKPNRASKDLYMPMIKMGVQNKNSEYLLLMADALLRDGGKSTQLQAIFDFMEETAWRDGTYRPDGIDTIQFESAVKTGLMGVVDLNGLNYNETIETLREAALDPASQTGYNDAVVDALPFDDYMIQQEIPSHFRDGEQQQGSQDRVLAVTDLPNVDSLTGIDNEIDITNSDGVKERITVKEAKDRYFKAISDNVNRSVAALEERLGLDLVSKPLRNVAMSQLLKDEMLKDGKFGADMLWACSTNENGEFNIPLDDPVHSTRIEQLLNSIIRRTVYKQPITGGPVVQVSSWGALSRNQLHVRFKDVEGNILMSSAEFAAARAEGKTEYGSYKEYLKDRQHSLAYLEAYISPYSSDIIRDFGTTDENGNFYIDVKAMEKANPKLLEVIGYRIPTEDKYSILPIKIVGFLPIEAGETIMLPAELTTFTGSGFDFDKMYIMAHSLVNSPVRSEDTAADFVKSIGYNRYSFLSDTKPLERTEKNKKANQSSIRRFRNEVTLYLSGQDNNLSEAEQKRVNRLYKAVLRRQNRNVQPQDPVKRNNNTIVDTQWAILTSPLVAEQILTAQSFDPIKKLAYGITAVDEGLASVSEARSLSTDELKNLTSRGKNICFPQIIVDFHRQNMVAAKLIGVFAQANISHGIINLYRDADGNVPHLWIDPKHSSKTFKLRTSSGSVINVGGNVYIDSEFSSDGVTRISRILAQFLAASVDAVKDPVLNLLNINMTTVNSLVTMIRLGCDIETAGWFLSSPVIKEVVRRHELKSSGKKKSGYVSLRSTIEEYQREIAGDTRITFDTDFAFDRKFFESQHSENRTAQQDWSMLELLKRLENLSSSFRNITNMTRYNSISSGVGPFYSDNIRMELQKEKFDTENATITDSVRKAVNNPLASAFRDAQFDLSRKIFKESGLFKLKDFEEKVIRTAYRKFGYVSETLARELSRFAVSYAMNIGESLFDLSAEERDYILNEFPSKDYEKLAAEYADNPFIRAISRKFGAKTDTWYFTLDTEGKNTDYIDEIKTGWTELLKEEQEKAFESGFADLGDNLALLLFEYCFFKGGLVYSPSSFIHIAPTAVRLAVDNYYSNMDNPQYDNMSPEDMDRMFDQFMLNMNHFNMGYLNISDFEGITPVGTAKDEDGSPKKFVAVYRGKNNLSTSGVTESGIAVIKQAKGPDKYAKVTYNPYGDIITVTYVSKLGGYGRMAFEIDPSKNVEDMKSAVMKGVRDKLEEELERFGLSYEELERDSNPNADVIESPSSEQARQEDLRPAFEKFLDMRNWYGDPINRGNHIDPAADFEHTVNYLADSWTGENTYDSAGKRIIFTTAQRSALNELLCAMHAGNISINDVIKEINDKNLCG